MSVVAPLFSKRARERRAALRAARNAEPGATVELVLGYPLVGELAPGEYRTPSLLVANGVGVGIRGLAGSTEFSATWAEVGPLGFDLGPPPLLTIFAKGAAHQYYGVHGSGTFALSPQQLRRMIARVERKRPKPL